MAGIDESLYAKNSNIKKAFYGLPKKIIFCKNCVISNQRPSSVVEYKKILKHKQKTISFDNGVCDACLYNTKKETEIDWDLREKSLIKLLEKYKKKNGDYDVIVPGSGGKDSVFTSHILKYKYGMNPLTVTWAPHLYTKVGWQNFQNWIAIGGLDNILFTPNGRLHRYLTKKAFLNLLHPFQPFIVGQRIIGPMIAQKFGVSLVMYGENQAEYGNNKDENKKPQMDPKFFSSDFSKTILGGEKVSDIIKKSDFDLKDFKPYIPCQPKDIFKNKTVVHYLGYYLKWDPQECYYYAFENTNFQANEERTEGSYSKYSSIDDKIDPFHYYTTLIKFGIGRATYDAVQEIRNKKINREEGISLVKKFDMEFPNKYFSDFLDYIDITEEDFWKTIDKFRSPHLWYLEKKSWHLRKPVWNS